MVFLSSMSEKSYYEDQFQTRRERRAASRSKKSGGILEFLIILILAFTLVFGFVRPFVVEAFWIPSESMVPTLEVGDRVLANKFIYRFTEPQRGDVVVFRSVEGGDEELIKRVVGVPGDRISLRGGRLYVNNKLQKEPYLNKTLPDRTFYPATKVSEDHVFFMGDNRTNSKDSRIFGAVPQENIEGKAFLLFWPLNRMRLL